MHRMLARTALTVVALAPIALPQTWVETSKVFGPLGAPTDNYGWSVSMSGQTLLVGAPRSGLSYPVSFLEGLAFDPGGMLLAIQSAGSQQMTRIDLVTGFAVPLGTLPAGVDGLAFDPALGIAYTVQRTNEDALYALDVASWAVTKVGALSHPLLSNVRGLAFDSASGTLYGVDAVSDVLAVIDTGSGAGIVVGALGSAGVVTGLACEPATGLLYGSTESSAELVRIDPANGASSPVGPLGHTAVGALAFDPGSGVLYGWNATGSSLFYNGLLTIDHVTGVGTPAPLPVTGQEGAAFVLDLAGGTSLELRASDAEPGDEFGYDLALEGSTLVAGAYRNDDQGTSSGAAYVFEQDAFGGWTETAKLLPRDGAVGDWFGYDLDLSGDTVAVSAPLHDSDRLDQGSLYLFERSTGWAQTQVIRPPAQDLSFFGKPALDGDRLLVGHPDLSASSSPYGAGRAYVYERTSPGQPFSLVAALQASDPEQRNGFGTGLALCGDYAAVGAPGVDCGVSVDCGVVYVFERDAGGPGAWGQIARLEDPTVGNYDQIGRDLALEGNTLLVSYSGADLAGSGSGAVIEFTRIGGTWTHVGLIVASNQEAGDRFGWAVGLSGDTFTAGAYRDDGYVSTTGTAYTFDR